MRILIGHWLMCLAITIFDVFVFGMDLDFKTRMGLLVGVMAFLTILMIGCHLIVG